MAKSQTLAIILLTFHGIPPLASGRPACSATSEGEACDATETNRLPNDEMIDMNFTDGLGVHLLQKRSWQTLVDAQDTSSPTPGKYGLIWPKGGAYAKPTPNMKCTGRNWDTNRWTEARKNIENCKATCETSENCQAVSFNPKLGDKSCQICGFAGYCHDQEKTMDPAHWKGTWETNSEWITAVKQRRLMYGQKIVINQGYKERKNYYYHGCWLSYKTTEYWKNYQGPTRASCQVDHATYFTDKPFSFWTIHNAQDPEKTGPVKWYDRIILQTTMPNEEKKILHLDLKSMTGPHAGVAEAAFTTDKSVIDKKLAIFTIAPREGHRTDDRQEGKCDLRSGKIIERGWQFTLRTDELNLCPGTKHGCPYAFYLESEGYKNPVKFSTRGPKSFWITYATSEGNILDKKPTPAPTTPAPTTAPTTPAPTTVDPIPVPLKSCTASSERNDKYACENAFDGDFGKPRDDAGVSWATKKEGEGSWIRLVIDEPRKIDTLLYTNRRSYGEEENKDVELKFSTGKPAAITLKKTALNDHTLYSYCFPEVTTSFVKLLVKSHYSKADNGAEEIAFVHNQGACPNMLKENAEPKGKKDPTGAGPQGGGYYKPEPTGGNLPDGEIVPTTKTKCVAKCAANPACKAWNFRLKDSRCTLKSSTGPGFQPHPGWVSGEKGLEEAPACSVCFGLSDGTRVCPKKSTYHLNDLLTSLSENYMGLSDLKTMQVTGGCQVTLYTKLNHEGTEKTFSAGTYKNLARKWHSLKIS